MVFPVRLQLPKTCSCESHGALALFSLVRFDIHGGRAFKCHLPNDLNCTSLDRQRYGFDANFYASKLYVGSPNDVNFLFSVPHVSCTEISKLVSFGRACAYAACTVEGTSQAEVPSTEGPLAIWRNSTARTVCSDLTVYPTVETRTLLRQFTPSRNKFRFAIETRRTRGTDFAVSLTEKL